MRSRLRILHLLLVVAFPARRCVLRSPSTIDPCRRKRTSFTLKKSGEHSSTVSQSLVFKSENGDSWYEFKSDAP